MDISHIITDLNDAQRAAVTSEMGCKLILAGAGSGKTRVLIHRIAWLIEVENVSPWHILSVTFTNKAAKEMRGRAQDLLKQSLGGMWMGTFHGLAHRLLRAHAKEAGLPQNFQILDSDDQLRMIKRINKEFKLDDKKWPPRQTMSFINKQKDEGRRSQHIDHHNDLYLKQMVTLYQEYEQACQRGGLVDFGELLLRSHELWRDNADILEHYQARFQHILVDEFQDTNTIQYAWLRLLAGQSGHLFVVGDDDQSIYGWRGAKIENIRHFNTNFKNIELIKLEQNYRSTGSILTAANAVISNNPSRLGKNLWTAGDKGDPIQLYEAYNEVDEARFVADKIKNWVKADNLHASAAILYRSNAQSRLMEEALILMNIPYRVYGGLRFFERAEIKDALAYLRLVSNQYDDAAFERAVNQPPRGIGAKTLEQVRAQARANNQSLWQAATDIITAQQLPPRAGNALKGFIQLIRGIREKYAEEALSEKMKACINQSQLKLYFKKSRDGKGQDRIENLDELITATEQFNFIPITDEENAGLTELDNFLSHAALEAGDTQADPNADCVQLMTLHSAKGLEFPLVFLVGVEEGLFPHSMSADDPERLEEERRLCYVGITRAMQQLMISHAQSRRFRGQQNYPKASRFLKEIPADCIQNVRHRAKVKQTYQPSVAASTNTQESPSTGFKLGTKVLHPKFGQGVVLAAEGSGKRARIQVNFNDSGVKWLISTYANLEQI